MCKYARIILINRVFSYVLTRHHFSILPKQQYDSPVELERILAKHVKFILPTVRYSYDIGWMWTPPALVGQEAHMLIKSHCCRVAPYYTVQERLPQAGIEKIRKLFSIIQRYRKCEIQNRAAFIANCKFTMRYKAEPTFVATWLIYPYSYRSWTPISE